MTEYAHYRPPKIKICQRQENVMSTSQELRGSAHSRPSRVILRHTFEPSSSDGHQYSRSFWSEFRRLFWRALQPAPLAKVLPPAIWLFPRDHDLASPPHDSVATESHQKRHCLPTTRGPCSINPTQPSAAMSSARSWPCYYPMNCPGSARPAT